MTRLHVQILPSPTAMNSELTLNNDAVKKFKNTYIAKSAPVHAHRAVPSLCDGNSSTPTSGFVSCAAVASAAVTRAIKFETKTKVNSDIEFFRAPKMFATSSVPSSTNSDSEEESDSEWYSHDILSLSIPSFLLSSPNVSQPPSLPLTHSPYPTLSSHCQTRIHCMRRQFSLHSTASKDIGMGVYEHDSARFSRASKIMASREIENQGAPSFDSLLAVNGGRRFKPTVMRWSYTTDPEQGHCFDDIGFRHKRCQAFAPAGT
ncbi:hypothetical protein K435DRAFT_835597 [Dendrothele bispora CBS 962.96]|uniref:Uncharacterized protein n=1 Tax=Dendrothele bispora (strain CBS 962.96) TaxID=1314807 RepID=A0A4S8MMV5_DENBC|nr:hypothetical protein K435DRAFT_835597 [Dendrothele bispora CBS 962.96]